MTTPPHAKPAVFPALVSASEPLFADLARDDVFRLETRRLWLRWPQMKDRAALLRLASAPEVAEMTARIPHPYPPEAADRSLFEMRKGNALGTQLTLAIVEKTQPDELLGMVGVHMDPEEGVSLGYWLGKPYWSLGYATEAAQAMIDAAFTLTQARQLTARARVINPGSQRVLEKCGFRHDGARLKMMPERGGLFPSNTFSLDRKTWIAFKNWHGGLAMPAWMASAMAERQEAALLPG